MANWNKIVQRFLPGVKFKIVTDFGTSPPLPEGAVVIYVGGSYMAVNLWVKMFNLPLPDGVNAYDAQEVLKYTSNVAN